MISVKKTLASAALAAALGIGGLAATAGNASAYVACNAVGDCWHTDHRYSAPGFRAEYHPDDWYFHQSWNNDPHRHWRDYHEGRGYYRSGVWVAF
jgi:hypothetical protein